MLMPVGLDLILCLRGGPGVVGQMRCTPKPGPEEYLVSYLGGGGGNWLCWFSNMATDSRHLLVARRRVYVSVGGPCPFS